jgi:glycosyltransferase involved in cell wall biosynthesis
VSADAPLVFLSRVESIKGAHWAIEIARRTGQRLIIAGNHAASGTEGTYWKEQIEPWIGRDGIEYVGAVDDVQKNKLLGQARAMVVPIRWNEPFGIVFAESLACGTPVISCPTGSLPEIVREGVDGFLIRSIDEGCEAVGKLATIDRATCRRRAEDNYSPDVVVDRYLQLYERARAGLAGR